MNATLPSRPGLSVPALLLFLLPLLATTAAAQRDETPERERPEPGAESFLAYENFALSLDLWQSASDRESAGDLSGAVAAIRDFQLTGGDLYLSEMRLAQLAEKSGQPTTAATRYEAAAAAEPRAFAPWEGLLRLHEGVSTPEAASERRRIALVLLRLDPAHREASLVVARDLVERAQWADARVRLEQLVARDPLDAEALILLALAQRRSGAVAAAESSANRLTSAHPDFEDLGPAAIQLSLEFPAASTPSTKGGALQEAHEAAAQGQFEDAIAAVNRFAQDGGDRYLASMRTAELQRARGNETEALRFFAHASSLMRNAVPPRAAMMASNLALGKPSDAAGEARAVLRLAPAHRDALRLLSRFSLDQGDSRAALETSDPAVRSYPDDVALLDALGTTHLRQNRGKSAAPCFARICLLAPDDPRGDHGFRLSLGLPVDEPPVL